MLTLLRHPEALARLRADRTLALGAVEEVLRYEGSVAMINRCTVEPYAIGDTGIPVGHTLMFMFSPINRDPAVFDDPERFEIARSSNPHLSFGAGAHFCLGVAAGATGGRDRVQPAPGALSSFGADGRHATLAPADEPARA